VIGGRKYRLGGAGMIPTSQTIHKRDKVRSRE
jgi:hypothetical protein